MRTWSAPATIIAPCSSTIIVSQPPPEEATTPTIANAGARMAKLAP